MTDALARRCADLREPMLALIEIGVWAANKPDVGPEYERRIRVVRDVLSEGTDGITDPGYLAWHPVAIATLHAMEAAVRGGDFTEAWRLFKDPNVGFNGLGQACQGQPGW